MKGIIEQYGSYENLPPTHKIGFCEIWFNDFFDKQLNQSLWQDNFKVSHDKYFNRDYENIDELKQQAKIVRNTIRTLREELNAN